MNMCKNIQTSSSRRKKKKKKGGGGGGGGGGVGKRQLIPKNLLNRIL